MQRAAFYDAKLLKGWILLTMGPQQLQGLLFQKKHSVSVNMPVFIERATQRGKSLQVVPETSSPREIGRASCRERVCYAV